VTQLPTDRTAANTVAEHVADHNTLAAEHNELDGHAADTTAVHGITDTSVLETTTGSAAKVAAHEADSTSVHGITDTSALETTTGSAAKVAAHEADSTSVHGITDTAALYLSASHTKAAHDALAMSHDSLSDVSANDHHAQAHHAEHEPGGGDAMAANAAAGTASLRSLGTSSTTAAAGDHAHSGSLVLAVATKTTAYAAVAGDVILADATSGALTVTLPVPALNALVTVKKIDASSNNVVVARHAAETIDGGASAALAVRYASVDVISNGTDWFVI